MIDIEKLRVLCNNQRLIITQHCIKRMMERGIELIEKDMIWHNNLRSIRYKNMWCWHPFLLDRFNLLDKNWDIKSYTISNNTCSMIIKNGTVHIIILLLKDSVDHNE